MLTHPPHHADTPAAAAAAAAPAQITSNISHVEAANQELLHFVARALGCRITKLSLVRGTGSRNKILHVEGLGPQEVYDNLQERMARATADADRTVKKL
jgi:hypothetical protein